jgi:alanine-glyoxylate transaminase/serine-glyoxylate transaminase/serine-pyruvate transaminase
LAEWLGGEVLLTPGPVMLHERVVRALAVQPVGHRSEGFRRVLDRVRELAARIAGGGVPLVLTGSGTLAVESMVWSLVRPGDNVLLVSHGEFGERLGESLRRRGAVVEALRPRGPGEPVEPERVAERLETGGFDVLAMVYTETSMGLSYRDARRLAEKAHDMGARVIVDAVSGFAGEHVPPPGVVDAVATASQKALAGPPGLGFVVVSEEEAERLRSRGVPPGTPSYLDLSKVLRFHEERRETPFTPAVTLMPAMAEALALIAEEMGPEAWVERHRRRAERLYRQLPRAGLEPLVAREEYRAWTLAAFRTPVPSSLVAEALARRGIRVARGMGALRDQVVRVSTMGWSPDRVFDELPGLVEEALEEARRAAEA